MFRITSNKLIIMTRGDTGEITADLNIKTGVDPELHQLTENDIVYLGITEPNKPFECALVRKMVAGEDNIGDTSVSFKINHLDTEFLMPGTYYYSIKLEEKIDEFKSNVYTIIDKRKFTIID